MTICWACTWATAVSQDAGERGYLRVNLDKKYPRIVDRCRAAIDALMPPSTHRSCGKPPDALWFLPTPSTGRVCFHSMVGAGSTPGPFGWRHGRKCSSNKPRRIRRGLIDSDGCRVVANDRGVRSVRCHFSNRSDHIRALFRAALDELEAPWTRPRRYEVAVYRKPAVARLDEFVGPKF